MLLEATQAQGHTAEPGWSAMTLSSLSNPPPLRWRDSPFSNLPLRLHLPWYLSLQLAATSFSLLMLRLNFIRPKGHLLPQ